MQATQAVKIKFELDKKSSLFRNPIFFEFEIEKKSSDTRYFKNQVEIDRGIVKNIDIQMRLYQRFDLIVDRLTFPGGHWKVLFKCHAS